MQNAKYTHMSGSTEEQASLASVYINILSIRERLLEETPQLPTYQGIILDQPTLAGSYSEGATMSQSIILVHKGENLV